MNPFCPRPSGYGAPQRTRAENVRAALLVVIGIPAFLAAWFGPAFYFDMAWGPRWALAWVIGFALALGLIVAATLHWRMKG